MSTITTPKKQPYNNNNITDKKHNIQTATMNRSITFFAQKCNATKQMYPLYYYPINSYFANKKCKNTHFLCVMIHISWITIHFLECIFLLLCCNNELMDWALFCHATLVPSYIYCVAKMILRYTRQHATTILSKQKKMIVQCVLKSLLFVFFT